LDLRAGRIAVLAGFDQPFGLAQRRGVNKDDVLCSGGGRWVVHLACTKPKGLGYAAELWTRKALSVHVRQHAQAAGHPSLVRAAKATVQRILDEPQLQPHKVRYYLERRDPEYHS
jgi:hypothetical protein